MEHTDDSPIALEEKRVVLEQTLSGSQANIRYGFDLCALHLESCLRILFSLKLFSKFLKHLLIAHLVFIRLQEFVDSLDMATAFGRLDVGPVRERPL